MTIEPIDFPYNHVLCVSWPYWFIYVIPFTCLIGIQLCLQTFLQIKWNDLTDKVSQAIVRYDDNSKKSNISQTVSIRVENDLKEPLLPQKKQPKIKMTQTNENNYQMWIDIFNQQCYLIFKKYLNEKNDEFIINIILDYSHPVRMRYVLQHSENTVNKSNFKMYTFCLIFSQIIYRLYLIFSIIFQVLIYVLLCDQFYDYGKTNNNSNWFKFLTFNSMVSFHTSLKYFMPSISLMFLWYVTRRRPNTGVKNLVNLFFSSTDNYNNSNNTNNHTNTTTTNNNNNGNWCMAIINRFNSMWNSYLHRIIYIPSVLGLIHILSSIFTVYITGLVIFIWATFAIICGLSCVIKIIDFLVNKLLLKQIYLCIFIKGITLIVTIVWWLILFNQLYFSTYCWYQGNEWSDCVLYAWKSNYCLNQNNTSFPLFWQMNDWKSFLFSLQLWL